MSLRVWLPLDGTLENKGLSDINLDFSPTYITGGKIGNKCLASQLGWFEIPDMAGKKQMSFAYWVKINTATSTDWLDTFSWYSTDGVNNYINRQEFYTNSTRTNIWYKASQANSTNSSFVNMIGEWNHYVFTIDYDRGEACFYINGEITGTKRANIDTTSYIKGTGSAFLLRENGLDSHINDFRLYDHILSPMEVKQISQGLILHYLLNDKGFNNNIEYDCSGYCNNGIKIGTFQYQNDTPKYDTSTYAQGGTFTYLEGIILPSEVKTVSLWIKCAKTVNSAIFNDRITGLQIGLLNSLLYVNSLTSTKGFTTTHWKDNEWNHVVVINDNGTRFCYVNGQAETQSGSSNYYIHNTDKFWLWNHSYNNNNYSFKGNLSDLRIYCTVLSPEDILLLYHNSAYIDNQGNIYGAMYEEV